MEKYTFIVEKKIPGALGCYKNKKPLINVKLWYILKCINPHFLKAFSMGKILAVWSNH